MSCLIFHLAKILLKQPSFNWFNLSFVFSLVNEQKEKCSICKIPLCSSGCCFVMILKRSFAPLIPSKGELYWVPPTLPSSSQDMEAGHRQVSQVSLKVLEILFPKKSYKVQKKCSWCREIFPSLLRAWNKGLQGAWFSWSRDDLQGICAGLQVFKAT